MAVWIKLTDLKGAAVKGREAQIRLGKDKARNVIAILSGIMSTSTEAGQVEIIHVED